MYSLASHPHLEVAKSLIHILPGTPCSPTYWWPIFSNKSDICAVHYHRSLQGSYGTLRSMFYLSVGYHNTNWRAQIDEPDSEFRSLVMQLNGHLNSMQNNFAHFSTLREAISEAQAALDFLPLPPDWVRICILSLFIRIGIMSQRNRSSNKCGDASSFHLAYRPYEALTMWLLWEQAIYKSPDPRRMQLLVSH